MTKIINRVQPEGKANYPPRPNKPDITPTQPMGIWALLTDPLAIIPPTDFSSVASGLQSVTRVCGKLTAIVNAASTSVVLTNAIKNNAGGFALTVGLGVISSAAQQAGINPNDVVGSAIQRANDLVQSPIRFLEQALRARSFEQASFTSSGIADVFGALRSVSQLLTACQTFTDLITGGVTAQLGPAAGNTLAGRRLAAQGISISGAQIRAGLRTVTAAMRNLGTLWDPNLIEWIGTPAGLVYSLREQGIADDVGLREALLQEYIFLDEDEEIFNSSPVTIKEALRRITGVELQAIIERTGVILAQPGNCQTAADLCRADVLMPQSALDNIPYGDLENFGRQIASLGITNRVTWELIADTLDELDLPDIGLINNPSFESDMAALKPYLGYGSGIFGDATLTDLIGTAGGAAHTEAYQLISDANDRLESTAEGQALLVALEFYELHDDSTQTPPGSGNYNDPLYPIAEANLIAALEAVKNSPNPIVQQASADADEGILQSALQLVGEITNAVAMGYAVYSIIKTIASVATAIGTAIAGTAATQGADGGSSAAAGMNTGLLTALKENKEGFWSFTQGLNAVLALVDNIISAVGDATGFNNLIATMANPNTRGGQAILAMQAEARNKRTLQTLGIQMPSVDIEEEALKRRAKFGFGLTTEQQSIITNYAVNNRLTTEQTNDLIFVNAYYGYQRHFFEQVAGYYEASRARSRIV